LLHFVSQGGWSDEKIAVRWACEAGLPRGVVLMDAGYGASTELRRSTMALGLTYVAGILPNTTVWTSDAAPLPKQSSGRERPAKLMRSDAKHQPILGQGALQVTSREGVAAPLSSRFARVRSAHRDYKLTEEWLLVEWPEGEKEPTKYWHSTLPNDISFHRLAAILEVVTKEVGNLLKYLESVRGSQVILVKSTGRRRGASLCQFRTRDYASAHAARGEVSGA
jgi:SRSO17 transposase